MTKEFYILDTETASLQGGVCEIAWLVVNDRLDIESEFSTLVNPERPISEGAAAIHGITDEQVADKPTMAQIATLIDGPIHMIAHNSAFDVRMTKPHIVAKTQLCTLRLARQFIKGTTNHKLEVLQRELKLPEQRSHSALGDVQTVRDLLLHILNLTGEPLETYWKRAQMPKVLHKMPFGRHKGLPFNLVPKSHINWLLEQGDLDVDLEYTLKLFKDM